jgi:site-specific recombinase XerD
MSKRPAVTWDESVDRFLAHILAKGRSRYTLRNYTADLKRFGAWWSQTSPQVLAPEAITEYDLEAFKDYLHDAAEGKNDRKGQMPATINAKLSAVRSYLEWARRSRLITEVPQTDPVSMQRGDVKEVEYDEEKRLIRTVARGGNKRDLAIIEILLHVGVRVAELVAIEWQDVVISPNKGTLRIRAGKGGKWREVALNKTARRAFGVLETLAGRHAPDERVLRSQRQGEPLSIRGVETLVAKYGRKAGLSQPLHPHRLRHTCACRLVEKGVDIVTIARQLGHKSIQTTMRYLQRGERSLQAAVDKLDM